MISSRDYYRLHGAPISLFTRKLETAPDFYGVPYEQQRKGTRDGSELEARAGTHQIPVLVTPENWVLADTTPIIGVLDARFPLRRLVPGSLPRLLVHVVEAILEALPQSLWVANPLLPAHQGAARLLR